MMRVTATIRARVFALAAVAALAACSNTADPVRMRADVTMVPAEFQPPLRESMCVGQVTGAGNNPFWAARIGNREFEEALSDSLRANRLLAGPGRCRFVIDVNLVAMTQPSISFSMEVTARVAYRVAARGRADLLQETITSAFTATFSDSPVGATRLQRANEGAIRENIAMMLARLRAVQPR